MIGTGATVGVEEEYHLVDADTFALADAPDVLPEALRLLGDDAKSEISTSQLEIATPVSSTLDEVRAHLARLRRGADEAAQKHGCRVLGAGTHPTARWQEQRLTDDPRYARVHERYGLVALQQLIAGCHVHVSVADPELAVQVVDRVRPDLPLLLALGGSSPYWESQDSGYASYRTIWFSRFPVTGSPEVLRTRAAYEALVRDLVVAGVADDARGLYWDARPSLRYPTVEVRISDTCPVLDDAVLQVALSRALVRAAARDALDDRPFAEPRPELVKAARWRAARLGLEGDLIDLRTATRAPAPQLVRDLLTRLREDLEHAGEWDEAVTLTEQLLTRGTSARQQRAVGQRQGLTAVVSRLVEQTTGV